MILLERTAKCYSTNYLFIPKDYLNKKEEKCFAMLNSCYYMKLTSVFAKGSIRVSQNKSLIIKIAQSLNEFFKELGKICKFT